MHEIIINTSLSRAEKYAEVLPQIQAVIEGETDLIANLANISAILKSSFGFFWIGFYLMKKNEAGAAELVLGPFQGPLACTRIAINKGVCGAAARQQKTIVVPDVEQFEGHIACSSASRSEIVVPLIHEGKTQMVLDIDSVDLNTFSEIDAQYLEQLMDIIKAQHFD